MKKLINPHQLSLFMKEVIERSSSYIRQNRYKFESKVKINEDKKKTDFVTNIDVEAQKIVVKLIQECYPDFGIIAEESEQVILLECKLDPKYGKYYFTIDPLDGTSAFKRMQSEGIGSMLSLIWQAPGESIFVVLAACISDVMTGEIYYYRPESENVHRIEPRRDSLQRLSKIRNEHRDLKNQYCLLRNDPRCFPLIIQEMTLPDKGLFQNILVDGGSIGICLAKLWKGQVGAIVLEPGTTTPWDWDPIYGISKKLGYEFLYINEDWYGQIDFGAIADKKVVRNQIIIFHISNKDEIIAWIEKYLMEKL